MFVNSDRITMTILHFFREKRFMKKLSAILLSVFVLFVGAFMAACGQNVKIKFTDQDNYVELYIGDELKLTEMISVEGAEIGQVSFVSLGNFGCGFVWRCKSKPRSQSFGKPNKSKCAT